MFEKKLVAVMNKSVESGVVMNALGHLCVGFGASVGGEEMHLVDYLGKDEEIYPNISKMPFIILRAGGNKVRNLYKEASSCDDIKVSAFTDTMTGGGWEEQLDRTKDKLIDEL